PQGREGPRADGHRVPAPDGDGPPAIAFVLVAGVSAGALAIGSYLLVQNARLSDSLTRARDSVQFQLTSLAPSFLPLTEESIDRLKTSFEHTDQHAVLITNGNLVASNASFELNPPPSLRATVQRGLLGYQREQFGSHHLLIVGGRIPGSPDELYLLFNEDRIYRDLTQLRNVLLIGWGAVLVLAGLVGSLLARRTLGPVAKASQAARSMAEGLLATRLPVEGQDEFGAWATSFNEMADALESKITALSEAQARERRFTSDVAHELRTPLTALVGEASMLREHVERMPQEARRPAELLIQDVTRLRRLVEELMEISRFDAGRETVQEEPVELLTVVGALLWQRGWVGRVSV